jgi:hypothetical protein
MTSQQTEPSVNDLSPMFKTGVEKEPIFLIDTSGSMSWPNTEGGAARYVILGEAIGNLVGALEGLDSQAAHEKEAGEDAGGVMTVLFSDKTEVLGDLSSANVKQKWDSIAWGGGTIIQPGWDAVIENYMEEFGDTPKQDRPHLLAVIFTDGEANDTDAFASTIAKSQGGTYALIVIMGYGPEHDRALQVYQDITKQNDHVRVVTFGNETDPKVIADGLLSMVG